MRPGPIVWRWRSLALYAAAGALAVVAVGERTPVPLFLAVPLLLAPLSAGLLSRSSAPARLAWTAVTEQDRVRVRARVTWRPGSSRAAELDVDWRPPPGLARVKEPRPRYEGDTLDVTLDWRAASPVLARAEPPTARWIDPLGLMERTIPLEGEPLSIALYPPELRRLAEVPLPRTIVLPGETRSRRIGESGEFFALRPARPTDPPRRTNWAATARTGRRWVNEFRVERTGDLLILIDARPTEMGRAVDGRLLSVTAAMAYGVADAFLEQKARVGLGIYGEFLDFVALGSGRTQRLRLRERLLRAEVALTGGPSERAGVSMARVFPRGVTTLVLSPLVGAESLALLTFVRRRGFPLVVASPSPLRLAADSGLDPESSELARRLAQLARDEEIEQGWRDAPTIDCPDFWSLERLVGLWHSGLGVRRRT